jgi:tetratricopeptide (TPR) repeat protein
MRLREEIILADPSAANSMELATVLDHLGAFLLKERPAEAEDLFRKGLDLREALLREAPDDPARQAALGGTLHNRANALSSLGRVPETPALYERAIGLQRAALAKAPQSPDSQRFLRLHCLHLSNSLIVLGEHARGAVAAAELPVLDPESAADHWEAGRRLMICADLAGKDERLDPADRTRVALEYAHKARTILGRATQLAPGDTMCWGALGWACVGAEDWEGAVAALDRDLGPGVGPFEWFLLATAHARLGHAEEARRWYDEAVAWMDEHRANDKLRTQRAGVERLLGIAEKH